MPLPSFTAQSHICIYVLDLWTYTLKYKQRLVIEYGKKNKDKDRTFTCSSCIMYVDEVVTHNHMLNMDGREYHITYFSLGRSRRNFQLDGSIHLYNCPF